MTEHFNELDPAEAELLALLAEESGEIIQAIGKILRHGMGSYNPLGDQTVSNQDSLEKEIGDLNAVCARMVAARLLRPDRIRQASDAKAVKIPKWTHHQPDSLLDSTR